MPNSVPKQIKTGGASGQDVPPAGCGLFCRGCGVMGLIHAGEGKRFGSGRGATGMVPTVLLLHWRKGLPLPSLAPRLKAGVRLDCLRL